MKSLRHSWSPSSWGQTFTSTPSWQIRLEDDFVYIDVGSRKFQITPQATSVLKVTSGVFWSSISFMTKDKVLISLDGIPNDEAQHMLQIFKDLRVRDEAAVAKEKNDKDLIAKFSRGLTRVMPWIELVQQSLHSHQAQRRWLSSETASSLLLSKPSSPVFDSVLQTPAVSTHIESLSEAIQRAVSCWQEDLDLLFKNFNQKHLESELIACKDFLDTVEKSPLTIEQARSVICFDSRIQVIASAGSGKTSTMVAKAGYALHRELILADQILLLAFNSAAAEELQVRIQKRLEPLGLSANKVVARTFHAFGLGVIGQATGKKPSLAPWLENGGDIEKLSDIIDDLKDRDAHFRATWDLFRMVFSRDLPKFGSKTEHEDWDYKSKETGFQTLQGEIVKSHEERLIADWLFYNGVEYRYEQPYEIDTADPEHRQYRPDFYYPAADAYHEHFALDAKNKPPKEFTGYLEGVKWKRQTHKENKTDLWETTSASIWSGKAFDHLSQLFQSANIRLDPNPDRVVPGRKVLEHKDLVRTFRTFLTHAKSNCLTNDALKRSLEKHEAGTFRFRHQLFLNLFEIIREEWDSQLKKEQVIDFEDMLNSAAELLEGNHWQSPFKLVMVDEFQDASRARARLTRALVQHPGCFLFAVGDDWQSINRFAGADISVMTQFENWFGKAETLRLERTFRCPQSLCTISSQFVLKNPAQITKSVKSTQQEFSPTIQAYQVSDESKLREAIGVYLKKLHQELSSGKLPSGKNKVVDVYILGRYRKDAKYISTQWSEQFSDFMNIKFMTMHASKGLEADYVILPRLNRGAFPSTIVDDPILRLAMPQGESHLYAEERRLFYVALTRAKRNVALFTVENKVSEFITELIKDHHLELICSDGKVSATVICQKCNSGSMIRKTRQRDGVKFWGCSHFPRCRNTAKTIVDRSGKELLP